MLPWMASFSGSLAAIIKPSPGNGLCSPFSLIHGARIHTSRSSLVVRITGIAFGWIGRDGVVRLGGEEFVNDMRPEIGLGLSCHSSPLTTALRLASQRNASIPSRS